MWSIIRRDCGKHVRKFAEARSAPGNTAIYCAHEYTLANLKYATIAEPENREIQKHLAKVEELRLKQHATVPTTLVIERLTNPFLRAKDAADLAARRLQKDNF